MCRWFANANHQTPTHTDDENKIYDEGCCQGQESGHQSANHAGEIEEGRREHPNERPPEGKRKSPAGEEGFQEFVTSPAHWE
jgi:hypothetical protein